jgi:ectoine hydroxylase-related dioxygenase (phytanoyl-CoA dioxygenase family)
MKPFLKSNAILNDAAKLRRRAERDGYLFFRGLLPEKSVLRVRRDFARILKRHGWLDDGTPAIDVASSSEGFIEGSKESLPVFCEFQRLESFHAFAHSVGFFGVLDKLFGEKTFVHPQKIGRISFPAQSNFTTPAHQDFVHIQGTTDCWTVWIPLGDCPGKLGGLAVFAGSQKLGLLTLRRALGPGSSGVDVSKLNGEWRTSDFRAGDVLFFNSLTIHKALPNRTGNRVRLSVDNRYQGASEPLTKRQLLPHFDRFPWPVVYEGWKSRETQERLSTSVMRIA